MNNMRYRCTVTGGPVICIFDSNRPNLQSMPSRLVYFTFHTIILLSLHITSVETGDALKMMATDNEKRWKRILNGMTPKLLMNQAAVFTKTRLRSLMRYCDWTMNGVSSYTMRPKQKYTGTGSFHRSGASLSCFVLFVSLPYCRCRRGWGL